MYTHFNTSVKGMCSLYAAHSPANSSSKSICALISWISALYDFLFKVCLHRNTSTHCRSTYHSRSVTERFGLRLFLCRYIAQFLAFQYMEQYRMDITAIWNMTSKLESICRKHGRSAALKQKQIMDSSCRAFKPRSTMWRFVSER